MNDYTQCHVCRGSKRVMGAGFMTIDCNTCKATGYVTVTATEPVEVILAEPETNHENENEQLRADLGNIVAAYESLQKENDQLKAEIESLKKAAKSKRPKK